VKEPDVAGCGAERAKFEVGMSRRRRRSLMLGGAGLALVVAAAVALVALTGLFDGGVATVGPEGGTISAEGVTIKVPPGAVSRETEFGVERASDDATELLRGTNAGSGAFAIDGGAPLRKPVELSLPVSTRPRSPDGLLAASRERAGEMWILQPGEYDREAKQFRVSTRRLSAWQVVEQPEGGPVATGRQVTSALQRLTAARARPPTCTDPPRGYALHEQVGARGGNGPVSACLGESQGETILEIANNRAIGIEYELPAGLRLVDAEHPSIPDVVLDAARKAVGGGAWRSVSPKGRVTLAGKPARTSLRATPTRRAFVFELGVLAAGQSKRGGTPKATLQFLGCFREAADRLGGGAVGSPQAALDSALSAWGRCGHTLVRTGAGASANAGAAFFGGLKAGPGLADALGGPSDRQRTELRVREAPVPTGTSCGTFDTGQKLNRGSGSRRLIVTVTVDQGRALCSESRELVRWYATADNRCVNAGNTCPLKRGAWVCSAPSAGSYPQVYRCDRKDGTAVLATDARPQAVKRSCGDLARRGFGIGNLESVDVDCDTARRVTREWEAECATRPSGSCSVSSGFACEFREVGFEGGDVSCTKGNRRVDFMTGA